MSVRRLQALIVGLPLDCALARSIDTSGRLAAGWTAQTELSALSAELLDLQRLDFLAANGVKRSDLPKALHVPRPGAKPKPAPSPQAVTGFFAQRGVPVLKRRKRKA